MLPMRLFVKNETKQRAVIEAVRTMHSQRRPILIGTRSVAASGAINSIARIMRQRFFGFAITCSSDKPNHGESTNQPNNMGR